MFHFKHFTGLQWLGFFLLINFSIMAIAKGTGTVDIPGFIVICSVIGGVFSAVFIEWPKKDGFKRKD